MKVTQGTEIEKGDHDPHSEHKQSPTDGWAGHVLFGTRRMFNS